MKSPIRIVILLMSLFLSGQAHSASADWWVDITNDRIDQVRTQLSLGEDPNAVNDSGQPSIMLAIQEGAWQVYDLLVRHRNINVNIANANDETPLMYLAVIGQTRRADGLIKRGAEVNRLGWTPLHYAASKGHLDTVKLLLANAAMVNAPSPDGTSPLMMAAYDGSEEVARALLNAGADPTARNLRGEDAADWARRRHHSRLAAQLDDLTERMLKSRAAGAGGVAGDAAAPSASGHVHTLDTVESPLPDALGSASGPADAAGQSTTGGGASEDAASTSRYFDLKRFEQDEDRF